MDHQAFKKMLMKQQSDCVTQLGRRYLAAVRPIYAEKEDDESTPDPIGSCFLLRFRGAGFLVTAAHVLDHRQTTRLFVGPLEGSPLPLDGEFYATGTRETRKQDHLDFAFWRLPSEMIEKLDQGDGFIREDEIANHTGNMTARQYVVIGFPISKNKKAIKRARFAASRVQDRREVPRPSDAAEPKKMSFKPSPYSYQSSVFAAPKLMKNLGLTANEHIVLKRDRRSGQYDGTVDNSIDPHGVSGGALFDRGESSLRNLALGAPCVGLLAGLLIEGYPEHKALLFTKIDVILDAISHAHADLR